ncbi:XRE family transcriptional regulator [Xenorhabdus entomophaga]|uniref:XRE family transcriptional regulator n=1 Tax=Xenorhabdus entomophaga TaxID=3136257 RepID=UPI0030F4AD75
MKIGSRIRSLRKAQQMTILELANAINSDVGNISRLERDMQGYTDSTISKIAGALGVQVADLFVENDVSVMTKSVRKNKYFKVMALDVAVIAGHDISTREFIETIGSIEYTPEEARLIFGNRREENVKVIAVKGDGMSGTIESGDQIFIDITVNCLDGDGVYIFSYGRSLHVKRLQIQKDKIAVLSDNPNYETWYIEENEEPLLYIKGKVISHVYRRMIN